VQTPTRIPLGWATTATRPEKDDFKDHGELPTSMFPAPVMKSIPFNSQFSLECLKMWCRICGIVLLEPI
jgi:hypothetical protein